MSSQLLVALALMLGLAGAGLWLWQRAHWMDQRQASGAGLDQLLALDQQVAPEPMVRARRRRPIEALLAEGDNTWVQHLLLRAGLSTNRALRWSLGMVPLSLALAGLMLQGVWLALAQGVFGAVLVWVWLRWRIGRQRLALSHAMPPYLDAVVRLMTVGHSVQSAFQSATADPSTPLGQAIAQAARLQAGGMEPDQALHTMGELYDSTELMLLASILRMGMRFGGRADLIIARVAVFIRDREQAQQDLLAQSAETRLSAWVLGLLPLGIALYIIAMNPKYIGGMWADPLGHSLLMGALGLQLSGAFFLYKMAKSLED